MLRSLSIPQIAGLLLGLRWLSRPRMRATRVRLYLLARYCWSYFRFLTILLAQTKYSEAPSTSGLPLNGQ